MSDGRFKAITETITFLAIVAAIVYLSAIGKCP